MAGRKGRSGGHNRKPTAAKVLHHTWRADRAAPDEPAADIGMPDPPPGLEGRALDEWHKVGPSLVRRGILDKSEHFVLASYCHGVAECERLRLEIDTAGHIIEARGSLARHPATLLLNEAHRRTMDAAGRLGLTPADRSRVSAIPTDEPESVSGALDRTGKR